MYLDFIAEAVDVAVVLSDDAEVFFVEVIEVVVEVGVAYQSLAFAFLKLDIDAPFADA